MIRHAYTAAGLLPALFILNAAIAVAFVTHQWYQYQPRHHKHQHQRFDIYPLHSSASGTDLRPTLNPTTSKVITTPIQLLSSDERDRIDQLVRARSEARWNGDYTSADEIRASIDKTRVVIPWNHILQTMSIEDKGILIDCTSQDQDIDLEYKVMVTDIPRSDGGGSQWELVPTNTPLVKKTEQREENILQLAHAALGMAASASERGIDADKEILNELISRAEGRLRVLKQRKEMSIFFPGAAAAAGELHGRKAADAILWFALSGAGTTENSMDMFNDLIDIATEELQRFGMNSSCRAKDVLHIVERVAMAGIVGESSKRLYRVAASCLETKMESYGSQEGIINETSYNADEDESSSIDYGSIIESLRDFSFGLHSDRSLLGLWRFSTRQRKQRAFFQNAARHFDGKFRQDDTTSNQLSSRSLGMNCGNPDKYNWSAMFEDPGRPLVVDVGCGMGVSLLGLASSNNGSGQLSSDSTAMQMNWNGCNFIGVDLSNLAIGYAQSVCSRWGLGDLNFVVDSAENCLDRISETYPGQVALVMLQFPTPYRFESIAKYNEDHTIDVTTDTPPSVVKRGFNSQLPEGAASDDFMVTKRLLSQIHDIVSKRDGQLLIQSNCEDVAVHMRNVATTELDFQSVPFSNTVTSLVAATQRAQRWVESGGERAIGKGWSEEPLLPLGGRTETEVACLLDGKPVHRCLLRAS